MSQGNPDLGKRIANAVEAGKLFEAALEGADPDEQAAVMGVFNDNLHDAATAMQPITTETAEPDQEYIESLADLQLNPAQLAQRLRLAARDRILLKSRGKQPSSPQTIRRNY